MVVVTDAGGAAIGGWQPGLNKGFGVIDEPGAPSWFELHTRDYEASVRFYEDVFKWDAHTVSDAPEFRYTTLGEGDDALAGIMDASAFLPDGVPAHWSIYFGTADADASRGEGRRPRRFDHHACRRHALRPARHVCVDPTGASFKLRST